MDSITSDMKRLLLASILAAACSGCASIVNDSSHPIKVETRTETGQLLTGADCKLTNDYGMVSVESGETAQVRRSSKDLDITCRHAAKPDAVARAISRVNAGMFGNIIFGGGIGAIIG